MSRLIHVFAGPSLPAGFRPRVSGVVFQDPAAQGDVYALVESRPFAIALIDGYFQHTPAVWHKELLWAMSRGIHVVGGASMGALRAAELSLFGMVGVGRIFEEYSSQRLQDDDEVALVHGDESSEYRPISEPMVNLRATLRRAESEGLLAHEERCALEAKTKQRFYADRSYSALLESARVELTKETFLRFEEWLRNPLNRVDQKRQDALAVLDYVVKLRDDNAGPLGVPWTFQHTDAWEQVRLGFVRRIGARALASTPPRAERLPAQVEIRQLRVQLARQAGFQPDAEDIRRTTADFCRARGLTSEEAFRAFISREGLNSGEFEKLMADEACVRFAQFAFPHDFAQALRAFELVRGHHDD